MTEDWAMRRAIELVHGDLAPLKMTKAGPLEDWPAMIAFAKYIREHETEPEDPDLIEARQIAKD